MSSGGLSWRKQTTQSLGSTSTWRHVHFLKEMLSSCPPPQLHRWTLSADGLWEESEFWGKLYNYENKLTRRVLINSELSEKVKIVIFNSELGINILCQNYKNKVCTRELNGSSANVSDTTRQRWSRLALMLTSGGTQRAAPRSLLSWHFQIKSHYLKACFHLLCRWCFHFLWPVKCL